MLKKYIGKEKRLIVLKGFEKEFFYENLGVEPLINNTIDEKENFLNMDKTYLIQINKELNLLENSKYITYEEFILIIENIGEPILRLLDIDIVIVTNNLYPNYFYRNLNDKYKEKFKELFNYLESEDEIDITPKDIEDIQKFIGDIKLVDKEYFFSYKTVDLNEISPKYINFITTDDIKNNISFMENNLDKAEYIEFEFHNDINILLSFLLYCKSNKNKNICIICNEDSILKKYDKYIKIITNLYSKNNYFYKVTSLKPTEIKEEFHKILKDIWGYDNFKEIEMYKCPDENKETVLISQGQIIQDIVQQSEKAIKGDIFKDIFITAPTGAGKSIIFQLSALYLAKYYSKLTIIISPLIALMKDQIDNLEKYNITNAAYLNSELNFIEREEVIRKVKDGKIDILYISPETLVGNSISNIIGDREIGLFIVDESHIVTTWGRNFRPDYLYLGKYIQKIRSTKNKFPICTFTATAVYGGNDDMCYEIADTLGMKSTIKYLGCVKRDNIEFDIKSANKKVSFEEYKIIKSDVVANKICDCVERNIKTIIYFPYAETVYETYQDKKIISVLDKVSVYTGRTDKENRNDSFERFKNGESVVLLATKAFGMGIDIHDIEQVYHFAPTGTLSDYVQEIGRVARTKDILGVASMDFYSNDFRYINQLEGMSSIKQKQIKQMLKKIYDIYKNKDCKRNFLITPLDFAYIFPNESAKGIKELERKIKSALLIIEKDLSNQFTFPVIISRPRNMFSKIYVAIDKNIEEKVTRSKYGKYFEKVSHGRSNELLGNCMYTDMGDIFLMNLKELWEDEYPQFTFAQFKALLLGEDKDNVLKFQFKKGLYPRYKINIKSNEYNLNELKDKLKEEMSFVNSVLDEFWENKQMFTIKEFENKLNSRYNDINFSKKVASSYFNFIEIKPTEKELFRKAFISYNSDIKKYRISSSMYHNNTKDILKTSGILSRIDNINDNSFTFYYNKGKKTDFDAFRILYLLNLFDLIHYEVSGGENPEIFIRLNDPKKLLRISSTESKYKNIILSQLKNRHENSIKIMNKFFTEIDNNVDRWNFIEDYFLGNDMLEDNFE